MALSLRKKAAGDDEGEEKAARADKPKRVKSDSSASARNAKSKRFILIVGDEGAILIFMHGAKVVRRLFAPSASANHSHAMTEIMQANPNVRVSVLVDVLDQQYVQQTFPPVSSMSVGGLVKRRLDRDFQKEDLKGAIQLGRDKTGRKEWKYLLVALVRTPLIAEWVDLVAELPNRVVGIYLVPVEAAHYISMLRRRLTNEASRPWQLLISHNKVSGFRQVVIHEGKLVFTRVSQAIDDAIPAVIAGNIEQEIITTMEYLKRLGFNDNAELDAYVVVSQDVIETLDLKRFGFGSAKALSPMNVSELLKLEQAALTADRFGDVVMAAAFGIAKARTLKFSNAYLDKLSKLYQARKAILAFAVLVALVLIGLMISTGMDMASDMYDVSHGQSKQLLVTNDLAKFKKSVDGLNEDVAFKSAVIATIDSYFKDELKPEDFVTMLAPIVTPQQRISGFMWEINDGTRTAQAGSAVPIGNNDKLPLLVDLNLDVADAGNTLDVVDKAANDFVANLKARLPQYDIVVDPYGWHKEESHGDDTTQELNAPSSIVVQTTVANIHLRGPKKMPGNNAPGGAPAPAMPAPVPSSAQPPVTP